MKGVITDRFVVLLLSLTLAALLGLEEAEYRSCSVPASPDQPSVAGVWGDPDGNLGEPEIGVGVVGASTAALCPVG